MRTSAGSVGAPAFFDEGDADSDAYDRLGGAQLCIAMSDGVDLFVGIRNQSIRIP